MDVELARLCEAAGIEPTYVGIDGKSHAVAEETLVALANALSTETRAAVPPETIGEVRATPSPLRCYIPEELENARVWGITCQLASLVSDRNAGIGDFADLAALCMIAATEGADFVGVNPLHALFWSDPARTSPFFPSNRRFLNPLYIAVDWVDGYSALREADRVSTPARPSSPSDPAAVARNKQRLLQVLFLQFPWTPEKRAALAAYRESEGEDLLIHAAFETISQVLVAGGHGATPSGWPTSMQKRDSDAVADLLLSHRDLLDFHVWVQWQANQQLADVHAQALFAGLRIGLYVDFAVGAAPDGSAAWGRPDLTLADVSIGAPPDPFSASGQNWGLAPLSPARLAELDARPMADIFSAAIAGSGAIRIDHAMGLARMWLVPRGQPAIAGAYVRYPLARILDRIAEVSQRQRALIIGEDLGVVPDGFRELMSERNIHCYKVLLTERDDEGFSDPQHWPVNALAGFGTHDMPTFTGWWTGRDLEIRHSLGLMSESEYTNARNHRAEERRLIRIRVGGDPLATNLSIEVHMAVAASPCRLAAMQIEDALGIAEQVNVPGTVSEYPNWTQRLPVRLEDLAADPGFQAHAAAMRKARPK